MERFQRQLNDRHLVQESVSLRSAVRGDHLDTYAAISHCWDIAAFPDESGEQLVRIQEYLRANPNIKYVWYDYWCMPQCAFDDTVNEDTGEPLHKDCKIDDRTKSQKDEFHTML